MLKHELKRRINQIKEELKEALSASDKEDLRRELALRQDEYDHYQEWCQHRHLTEYRKGRYRCDRCGIKKRTTAGAMSWSTLSLPPLIEKESIIKVAPVYKYSANCFSSRDDLEEALEWELRIYDVLTPDNKKLAMPDIMHLVKLLEMYP